jgi:O-antigen ligase
MMTAATPASPAPRRRASFSLLNSVRRSSDLGLAFAMGGLVGLLIFTLPMQAALATAVVGAFVLIMLVDTRVALLALLLVRASIDYFASIPLLALGGGVNTNALMSLLVIALGVAHIAMHRINIRRIPLGTPSALFVAVSFVTLAITPDIVAGLEDWLRILTSLIVYILVVDLMQTERERRWLLRVLVLAAVLPLCVGLWQFISDSGDHSTPGYNRILATFVHPSPYGFFLVQIFPLALVLFLHAQSRMARLGLGIMLPLIMLSIYATQTRGAWIGILVMVAVFMWFRARWTLLFIPLFLAAVYIGVPGVRARVADATTGTCESVTYCQSSVLWRTKQWEQVLQVASPPELVTVGAGLHSIQSTVHELSHNEYLRLLVETGAVGLALTVIVYVSLFRYTAAGFRDAATPYQRDLMLAFLMVLVSRVVMVGADNLLAITVIEWYFWAFAGVIVVESGAFDRFAHIQDDKRALRRHPLQAAPQAAGPELTGTPA